MRKFRRTRTEIERELKILPTPAEIERRRSSLREEQEALRKVERKVEAAEAELRADAERWALLRQARQEREMLIKEVRERRLTKRPAAASAEGKRVSIAASEAGA